MSVFTTLVKREFLEHKIAMFWVPIIIATLLAIAVASGLATGRAHFGADGAGFSIGSSVQGDMTLDLNEIAKTPEDRARLQAEIAKAGPNSGITITDDEISIDIAKARANGTLGKITNLTKKSASIAPVAASTITAPIFITALISILFMLLGSLHEERMDRSILFWKSMPASDTQTVLAKALTIIVGTLGIATLVSIILSIVTLGLFQLGTRDTAVEFALEGTGWISNFSALWLSALSTSLMYILWAAPVYAWLLLVSAAAPRAPFLFATMPIVAITVLEKVLGLNTGFGEEIGARLTGVYASAGIQQFSRGVKDGFAGHLGEAPTAILSGLASPGIWIGLGIAAVLLFGAIQMRKRKSI